MKTVDDINSEMDSVIDDIKSGDMDSKSSTAIIRAAHVKIANERLRMQYKIARNEVPESPYLSAQPKKLRRIG